MSEYYSNFVGSSAANVAFMAIVVILNCLRKRLNKSKCKSNCYIFDCEAQLDDLKHMKREVQTQRGILQGMMEIMDTRSLAPIFLEPKRHQLEEKTRDIENPTD